MFFACMLKEFEVWPELTMQLVRRITRHGQTAALFGAVWCKRCNNHVAPRFDRLHNLLNIGSTVSGVCQEVKDSAVMPDIKSLFWKTYFSDVAGYPCNATTGITEAFASNIECTCGQVQNGHISKSIAQQVVDEGGCAAANINDVCIRCGSDGADDFERTGCVFLKPTDRIRLLGLVNLFPVFFVAVHSKLLRCKSWIYQVETEVEAGRIRGTA